MRETEILELLLIIKGPPGWNRPKIDAIEEAMYREFLVHHDFRDVKAALGRLLKTLDWRPTIAQLQTATVRELQERLATEQFYKRRALPESGGMTEEDIAAFWAEHSDSPMHPDRRTERAEARETETAPSTDLATPGEDDFDEKGRVKSA